MDTAKVNTYRRVTDALVAVNEARADTAPGTPVAKSLDRAAVLLEKLSWQVLSQNVLDMAGEINKSSAELKKLTAKITASTAELQAVAERIRKAAEVVKVLTEILTKAASAGLL